MELNDELLCAYLDGELDGAARERVSQALESDAGARVRLERMRTADARLRREVPPAPAPAPDPIAEYIRHHEAGGASIPALKSARPHWRVPVAMAAAAAALAFAFLFPSRDVSPMDSYAQGRLSRSLETQPSGTGATAGEMPVVIVLTLRTRAGAMCRLFESRTGTAGEGVACREDAGWKIVAWDGTASRGDGFRTAGASPLLDAAMDRLGGEPLDAAAERAALARGWQSAPR